MLPLHSQFPSPGMLPSWSSGTLTIFSSTPLLIALWNLWFVWAKTGKWSVLRYCYAKYFLSPTDESGFGHKGGKLCHYWWVACQFREWVRIIDSVRNCGKEEFCIGVLAPPLLNFLSISSLGLILPLSLKTRMSLCNAATKILLSLSCWKFSSYALWWFESIFYF